MLRYLALTLVFSLSAHASVVVTITEVGADVVASFSGTIDTTGLTLTADTTVTGGILFMSPNGFFNGAGVGGGLTATGAVPAASVPTYTTIDTSGGVSTGDKFGFGFSAGGLWLPTGYVSGAALSGTTTYTGETLASLGLITGSDIIPIIGSPDTITLTVGVVPEPSSFVLCAFGLVALGVHRKRRQS